MTRTDLLRRLLPCLLALCLGGAGPSVLAAAPMQIGGGSEEETRSAGEHQVVRTTLPNSRCSRTAAAKTPRSVATFDGPVAGTRSPADGRVTTLSLRTLQVRIQV